MKKHIGTLLVWSMILMTLMTFTFTVEAQSLGWKATNLDKWQFTKEGSNNWSEVILPHSCNAIDGHSAAYYRGKTSYKKTLTLQAEQLKHPLFLLFCGAAQSSEVTINGKKVAAHQGGYTPFVVPLKDVKVGANEITVMCDNAENLRLIPVSSDFNKNNGLHNPVYLLEMNDVYASPESYGMYRMHVTTPNVSATEATTEVATLLKNASVKSSKLKLTLTLTDKKGVVCYKNAKDVVIASGDSLNYKQTFTLKNPHLWNGTIDPYLYTVQISIADASGKTLDKVNTKVGYRFYKMDRDKGFFLNGHSYPLRGAAMHQDMDLRASAVLKANTDQDYAIVKELGANFLRLAHYPHNDYEYQKCDEMGIIVQTEIPWVNNCGVRAEQVYFDNIHEQMKEMITNLYNHPSIVFWGMWNELDSWGNTDKLQGKADFPRVVSETAKLYDYAKSLDPNRMVGLSDDSNYERDGYTSLKADYYSENRYNGWYYGKFAEFGRDMLNIHKKMGICNVSEYGCGINPFCHITDTAQMNNKDGKKHFEEYGNLYHESYVRQIQKMPFLNFTSLWVMFDFPVANREEGYMDSNDGIHFTANDARKYTNDKGIVTRDRKIKKDVFYLYKSLWNHKITTVYITGRRMTQRASENPIDIKVYSNAQSLTLYQNGKAIQTMKGSDEETGIIWNFKPVKMQTSNDTFKVVANNGTSDQVTFKKI